MRLIDVDELKKKLEAEHCDCEIMAMIDNMPTATEDDMLYCVGIVVNLKKCHAKDSAIKNGWISVEDDLPKDSEKVLCLTVGNFYEILCKIIGGWRCPLTSQEYYTDFVRYWQPLPKLPERSDTNAERPL